MHLDSIIHELRLLHKVSPERNITRKELSQILTLFMHCMFSAEEISKAINKLDKEIECQ
jgi:hypothetical protein